MEEITIKDIARLCNVSVSTVSRAINKHPDINPDTLKQIQQVIDEYGYIPNNSARNLKRTESNTVAVLLKGITNPLFTSMIRVFETLLTRHKYDLLVRQVNYEEDELTAAQELVKEKRLKGVIFLGANYYHQENAFDKLKVPFVLSTVGAISEDPDSSRFSHVSVDDEKESCRAVRYLIEKGHRQIAILSAEARNSSVGKLRMSGYLKALKEAGIPVNPNLICPVSDDLEHYSMANGFFTTRKLLESGEKVTAIYAVADVLAAGAYRAIHEAGLHIPEDISVIGFDGIDLCDYLQPKLTTLAQPVDQIAMATFEQLYDLMEGNGQHKNIIYEGRLLEKESVAAI